MGAVISMRILSLLIGLILSVQVFAKTEIMVFVSFSMPHSSLVKLSRDIQRVNGVLILKGHGDGSKGMVMNDIYKILNLTKGGFIFRPDLFKELDIKVAPTFVIANFDNLQRVESFDKLMGNVSLEYVLETFSKKGNHQRDARVLLKKFRGGRD